MDGELTRPRHKGGRSEAAETTTVMHVANMTVTGFQFFINSFRPEAEGARTMSALPPILPPTLPPLLIKMIVAAIVGAVTAAAKILTERILDE